MTMTLSQAFIAILPVLALMTLASAIELLVPLRKQPRFIHNRVPINLTLITANTGVGLMLNGVLVTGALWISERGGGLYQLGGINGWVAVLLTIVLLDLVAYGSHVALHKVPWLWRVHLTHHTDVVLDATTSYRHHPIEPLLRWAATAAVAWTLGAPAAALALYRSLSALNSILEHANFRVPRWLDRSVIWFWVTPDMHKIHHSRVQAQTDSNYSNLFSIFDRLFGTFTPTRHASAVQYGVEGFARPESQRLLALLRLPFLPSSLPTSEDVESAPTIAAQGAFEQAKQSHEAA